MNSEALFSLALGLQPPWQVKEVTFSVAELPHNELHLRIGFPPGSRFPDETGQLCPVHAAGRGTSDPTDCLTTREFEVLRLLGLGFGTRQIAEKLNRSVKTIEAHRANIKEKLGLKTGMELIRFAAFWVETKD